MQHNDFNFIKPSKCFRKFFAKICAKNVSEKVKAVQRDLCGLWIHIKCNNRNYLDYRYLQTANNPGTALNAAAQSFLLTPYLVTKTSWPVVQTLIIIPLGGYI